MHWYVEVLGKYATFTGRARRREYWSFTIINVVLLIVLGVTDVNMNLYDHEFQIGLLSGVWQLVILLPSMAVTVRRLHDVDLSGWWLLPSAIPFLGALGLLVVMLRDGTSGENRFGADPKATLPDHTTLTVSAA